ncbi:hypothetical protein [Sphingobium yanoikuyae]|uniref:hypothetical protein n=1 Tax=Sphingobium yanoikuyae TaxID=13690 RepID=UPI0035AF5766
MHRMSRQSLILIGRYALFATFLLAVAPAAVLTLPAFMLLGGPHVDLSGYVFGVLMLVCAPGAIFMGLIYSWPSVRNADRRSVGIALGMAVIAVMSYVLAWGTMRLFGN